MTVFNPATWFRKGRLRINAGGTQYTGATTYTDVLVPITAENILANCPELLTLGDTNGPLSASLEDLRAGSEDGSVQYPLWAEPNTTLVDAVPGSSVVLAYVLVPEVVGSTETYVWLWWGGASAVTPEGITSTYGRNETFTPNFYRFYSLQEDISNTVAAALDATGNDTVGVTMNTGYAASTLHPSTLGNGQQNSCVASHQASRSNKSTPLVIPNTDSFTIAYNERIISATNATHFEFLNTVSAGYWVLQWGGSYWRWSTDVSNPIVFPPSLYYDPGDFTHFWTSNGSTDSVKLIRQGATLLSTTMNVNTDIDDGFFWHTNGSAIIDHLRIYNFELAGDRVALEHAIWGGHADFTAMDASVPAADASEQKWNNCPAGYGLYVYEATSPGTEPHGVELSAIASTVAGTNTTSTPGNAPRYIFYTIAGAGGHRIAQGYMHITAALTNIDASALLQPDPAFKPALAAAATAGVDYTLTHGSKLLSFLLGTPLRDVYSSLILAWRDSSVNSASKAPLFAVEREYHRAFNGWTLGGESLVEQGALDLVASDPTDTVTAEWVGVETIGDLTGCTVYYVFTGGSAVEFSSSGAVNQLLKTYEDGSFDYRSLGLTLYARRDQHLLAQGSAETVNRDISEPRVIPFVLDTSESDPDWIDSASTVDSVAPYTGMSLTSYAHNTSGNSLKAWAAEAHVVNDVVSAGGRWYRCTSAGTSAGDSTDLPGGSDTGCAWVLFEGEREVGSSTYYPYGTALDVNAGTSQQAHTWLMRRFLFGGADELRDASNLYGSFVAGVYVTNTGVFLDNVSSNVRQTDLLGVPRVPPTSVSYTLTGLVAGSEVRVFAAGTSTELGGVESSGTSFVFNYVHTVDFGVDIAILSLGYLNIFQTNITLTATDGTLPVRQRADRQYLNT